MRTTIKLTALIILILSSLNFLTPFSSILLKRSIENQINYLDYQFKNKIDESIQNRYPEGKIFSNSIFSLSLIEYTNKSTSNSKKIAELIDARVNRILETSTQEDYFEQLTLKYGIFYNGWINLVLKKYIQSECFQYSQIKEEVLKQHRLITNSIESELQDSIRLLESHSESIWPADNLVGLISINNEDIKKKWLKELISSSRHMLINHENDQTDIIRGSSQSLIIYLISNYKENLAHNYNSTFHELLIDKYLKVELVNEFEPQEENYSDFDSGPIIFGYGAVATIMNIKTQAALGNNNSKYTWALFNTISAPINLSGNKYYLLQTEPMFDIFMLWSSIELL